MQQMFTMDNGVIDISRLPIRIRSTASYFFTSATVSKRIKQLNHNGCPRPDNISVKFYKATALPLLFPLSIIFNMFVQTEELPEVWKCASVTPVFKKGAPSDPANYRPISFTSVACKLVESAVKITCLNMVLLTDISTDFWAVNLPQPNY